MIYLKFLSGDILQVEGDATGLELYDRLPKIQTHHIAKLFIDDHIVELDEIVPDESVVYVFIKNVYMLWYGSNGIIWNGDGTMCMNLHKEEIAWEPESISDDDIVMVDFFSYGVIPPYTDDDIRFIQEEIRSTHSVVDFSKEI